MGTLCDCNPLSSTVPTPELFALIITGILVKLQALIIVTIASEGA